MVSGSRQVSTAVATLHTPYITLGKYQVLGPCKLFNFIMDILIAVVMPKSFSLDETTEIMSKSIFRVVSYEPDRSRDI